MPAGAEIIRDRLTPAILGLQKVRTVKAYRDGPGAAKAEAVAHYVAVNGRCALRLWHQTEIPVFLTDMHRFFMVHIEEVVSRVPSPDPRTFIKVTELPDRASSFALIKQQLAAGLEKLSQQQGRHGELSPSAGQFLHSCTAPQI